ncbi:OLC1v1029180C1 [Oldenlandia corymbosa var. corymbosa]|uniref:non-specific serine/threonine protein kinase n=1 Tax=Oldenlandia corymbosa var. corymbosa TaxID=529605 RepID=A0AAV1CDR2_OLDCO|nr:OLC1v1029180C1 [Oldenlandia corymbosa var. corymbosa]
MDQKHCKIVLMNALLLLMITYCLAINQTNTETDHSALLALKSHITSDPHQILSKNWSSSSPSSSVCGWIGVRCSPLHGRVTSLNVSDMGLTGTIPPHLGNLSFLVSLDLSKNYFHGSLPQELSQLRRLRFLRLSYNNFSGSLPTSFPDKLQTMALHHNDFDGIIPSSISNLQDLQVLDLNSNSLTGNIPEEMGNLQRLTYLNFQYNFLVGSIPSSIFNISTLETLALTYNNLTGILPNDICRHLPNLKGIYLSGNQLSGNIPPSLSYCSQLQILSLSYNNFTGFIPKQLGNLGMLELLYVAHNNLQGFIPQEIGNLRSLKEFTLSHNKISGFIPKEIANLTLLTSISLNENLLTGVIPEEISNLHNLEYIYASFNDLYGIIPAGIFNISTLKGIVLAGNRLTGILPSNIGYQLPNLETISLYQNNLSGVIPSSIGNCSKLTILNLAFNNMAGAIPKSLGRLEALERLVLSSNQLTSDPSSLELDFLTSLTQCKFLNDLELDGNQLNGVLPSSIGNLSSSLQYFSAEMANIKGPIPSEIGNLSSAIWISLNDNQLTGAIPSSIQELKNLQVLSLPKNKIGGTLDGLCNLQSLNKLSLSENQVSGPIPDCFGNMSSLRNLSLSNNLLSSSIPKSIWKLKDILVLDLASNSFNGSLPMEIGNLKDTISMDLSMNRISGVIPSTLDGMNKLQNLSLASNFLVGSIPESVGKILSLTSLNLSHNNLSGSIPKSLEAIQSLQVFDVSFNHLDGEIPSGGPFKKFTSESFISNDALCGDAKFEVPPCPKVSSHKRRTQRLLVYVCIPLGLAAIIVLVLTLVMGKYWKKSRASGEKSDLIEVTQERISYYELLQATGGLDESNLLGSGSFGSVYKGILKDGRSIAVKVFHSQVSKAFESFDVECEVFRNVRHRNIVKVISSCSNPDFQALVLQYMSNGSLEAWLYSDNHFLSIKQRLNIMIDVASALHYLHHEYSTSVIHCDLKPSNVLLDEDMVAHVSDFGIAKMLSTEESMALTKTIATIGYIAPEYGSEGLISRRCDIYSYGIMLMEVFTRKKPSDEMFTGDFNLKTWVNNAMSADSILGVIDTNLLTRTEEHFDEKLKCLLSIMELALKCVCVSPKDRVSMAEVLPSLEKIRLKLLECNGRR